MTEEPLAGSSSTALHQPWRWWVLAAETLVVALLVVVTGWMWRLGVVPYEAAGPGATIRTSHQYLGGQLTVAVVAATLAGLVALDALRQLVLAARTRARRSSRRARRGDAARSGVA